MSVICSRFDVLNDVSNDQLSDIDVKGAIFSKELT